jgi:hypothetical protein
MTVTGTINGLNCCKTFMIYTHVYKRARGPRVADPSLTQFKQCFLIAGLLLFALSCSMYIEICAVCRVSVISL